MQIHSRFVCGKKWLKIRTVMQTKYWLKNDSTSDIHWKYLIRKAHKNVQLFTASENCREKCAHINKNNKQLSASRAQNKYLYTVYNTFYSLTNLDKYKHCLIQKIWNNWISGISRLCVLEALAPHSVNSGDVNLMNEMPPPPKDW